jgi:hypothetical protein
MPTDVTIIATTGTVEIITIVTIGTAGITTTVTTGIKEITGLKGQTVLISQTATGVIRADGDNQTVTTATATVVTGVDGASHHNQTETITEVIAAHQITVVAATGIVEVVTTTVNLLKTGAARVVHIARQGSKIISSTYIIKAITLTADGFLLLLKIPV